MGTSNICFLQQYTSFIVLYANTYKYGHTKLCWYRKGDEDKLNEIEIKSSYLKVQGFNQEGYYVFYTKDDKNNTSDKREIYFLQESVSDKIEKIFECAPKNLPSDSTINLIKKNLSSNLTKDITQKISFLVYKYLKDTNDIQPDELETFYQVIMTAQRYENAQSIVWNKNLSSLEIFNLDYYGTGYITTDGTISYIVILDSNNNFYKKIYTEGQNYIDLGLNVSGAYTINLYEDNELINSLSFIQFNEETRIYSWNEKIEQTNIDDTLIDFKYDNIAYNDIGFTDEEEAYLSQETKKNPVNYIVQRPQLSDMGDSIISVQIKDYPLLKALNKDFYIGVKESDLLFTNYFDNYTLIDSDTIEFNCNKNYLSGQMLFFVEDNEQNVLSNVIRYSFDEDFSDYYQKVRKMQFMIYSKRLLPLIEYKMPEAATFINSCFQTITQDTSTIIYEDIWLTLIEMVLKYSEDINKNKLISFILEDYNNSFPMTISFYNEPIIYYRSTDVMVFPARNPSYALAVFTTDRGSNDFTVEYYPSGIGALDLSVKEKGHYIIYAIDSETYKRSGVTYINTIRGEEYISNYNLKVEVM